MNFDVDARTILLVRHGSHAYGLNTPESDEDFKGVCIKPAAAYFGFTQKFEQMEHMGSKSDGIDKVVYSVDKFCALAADCNPNIIEVLHVDPTDIIKIDSFGEELRARANDFLSKKAKFTFAGYANAQLHRIKTHRKWLLEPPKAPPTREEFGLTETMKVSKGELGAFDSLHEQGLLEVELPKNVVTLFTREKAYQAAKTHYDQYLNWVKTRNPKRAQLEAKFGYDTKHGMHLMRLEMMGIEILEKHTVHVKWTGPEREYLMGIRNGLLHYDALVEAAEKLEARAEELYATSTLRKEPDRAAIDRFNVDLTERYLRLHG
jgi:hypothetical protein